MTVAASYAILHICFRTWSSETLRIAVQQFLKSQEWNKIVTTVIDGNPYVAPSQCYGVTSRFDMGEVASAAGLRRGALLYMEARKIIQKMGGKS